ncbi:MAG: hypothetical protein IJN39_04800 [Clostridia bacterium]|nr:hypothetical protein [Clostridia bacterium]
MSDLCYQNGCGCNGNDISWIWVVIIVVIVLLLFGNNNNSVFGNNGCC